MEHVGTQSELQHHRRELRRRINDANGPFLCSECSVNPAPLSRMNDFIQMRTSRASKPVEAGDRAVTFTTTLTAGSHQLAPVFVDAKGNEFGAYYAIVTKR